MKSNRKSVVVIGAGPCGLVALKEMREAGHDAIALEKGPGIGGLFSRTHDTQYDNLYLTISNMLMAYSDFAPIDPRIKYSSKEEYGAYLEAYADRFSLRPFVRTSTEVTRARFEGGKWRITTQREGQGEPETLEADVLLVATGSNHVARRVDLPGYAGRVIHSSEYKSPGEFAGKNVLVVGAGESAFDISADISAVAARTTVWSRSPLAPAPRFPLGISFNPKHDELEIMKDERRWGRARVSDFLEVMTTSRMANAAPLWAYSALRHLIYASVRSMNKGARLLSAWNRQNMIGEPLLGDQASVPTKSARLCTAAARGKVGVVVAKRAGFDGTRVTFTEVLQRDDTRVGAQWDDVTLDGVDTVVLCTGYQTDFSWLEAPGLDWNPRSWFKHCFPPGLGDKLMFLGWARPHQGGIPACAEILSRYIGMILAGTRTLPAAYAERAQREARDEDAYYLRARQSPNLVDYPAFMDSVARLVGCLPESPSLFRLQRLVQYWMYPNWPVWYRKDGPGAQPRLVGEVLDKFPLGTSYLPNPFILIALTFAFMQAPIGWLFPPRPGIEGRWAWKAKKHLLHGNG